MGCMTSMESLVMKMQVRQLIEALSTYDPTDHVAVKWYDKFEFLADLEDDLSDKSWAIVCEEFEQDDNLEQASRDFLAERCGNYEEVLLCNTCLLNECVCDDKDDW